MSRLVVYLLCLCFALCDSALDIKLNSSIYTSNFCRRQRQEASRCLNAFCDLGFSEYNTEPDVDLCERRHHFCVTSYSECLSPVGRQALDIGLEQLRRLEEAICSNATSITLFRKHRRCFDDDARRRRFVRQSAKLRVTLAEGLLEIKRQLPRTHLIAGICCTFVEFEARQAAMIEQLCGDVSGPNTALYFTRVLMNIVEHFVNVQCTKYQIDDNCDRFPFMASMIEPHFDKSSRIMAKSESFLLILLDIVIDSFVND
ncbi:hypothetical protein HDE_13883 [Halotydeus destructor]|nr:hypothetical protein HDE_13883 [Halotydeus destructor]